MRILLIMMITLNMAACSYIPWFGDEEEIEIEPREPAELSSIKQEITLQRNWSVSGSGNGEEKYTRLRPLFFADRVAFTDTQARISVHEVAQGKTVWSRSLSGKVSGGVGGNAAVAQHHPDRASSQRLQGNGRKPQSQGMTSRL